MQNADLKTVRTTQKKGIAGIAVLAMFLFVCGSGGTHAQEKAAADPPQPAAAVNAQTRADDPAVNDPVAKAADADSTITGTLSTFEGGVDPNAIGPIVFTYWERAAIQDARKARGLVRPPTEAELMRDLGGEKTSKNKPPPEEREVRLGGIVYIDPEEWTIWLNGKRVTPDALPPEVLDLQVYKEYVEIKWLDDYTNQILPLRLRAHERFNIDARIFLPG